jgi:hypothetical protein
LFVVRQQCKIKASYWICRRQRADQANGFTTVAAAAEFLEHGPGQAALEVFAEETAKGAFGDLHGEAPNFHT